MDKNKETSQYDIEALRNGIEKCKKNVEIFEKAINDEYETIKRYRGIIARLEG